MAPAGAAFLASALARDGELMPLGRFPAWLAKRRAAHPFEVEEIPFAGLRDWGFDPRTGNLAHKSGRFFTIEGIEVATNFGGVPRWSQPIINQPEIGTLGILGKRFHGVLHFLMQAKMEPGNVNLLQLAPTLQATRSNLMRVHEGRAPLFAEQFASSRARVLVDALQSEQGARFLRKRNRNIIVETDEDVPEHEDFCWLTLGQIHALIARDNVVNMDARTVLSGIPIALAGSPDQVAPRDDSFRGRVLRSILEERPAKHEIDEILHWFTRLKVKYDLEVQRIPLRDVRNWYRDERRIAHQDGRFFSVIAVDVRAENREVPGWTQPLVKPCEEGLVAFITREIGGVLHFLVQAKVEAGNFDVIELAPTVQCITGSYRNVPPAGRPEFLDFVLGLPRERIRVDTLQSEEGGRFYREVNRNLVVEVDESFPVEVPENFMWMTMRQLKTLIQFNNFLNVECRCLLGSMSLAAGGGA
jgi:dTDP-4-dehydro-6-deoxy-alpha-D-glucopyranose 2,3-dehydratase